MKIPYIKIPIADVAAYIAPYPAETKGLIFQAVLNYGLYQKWDNLELPEQYRTGYTAVQEIVENEIKNYKKFCKEQKQKSKKRWLENQNPVGTAALPGRYYQTETKTETEDINIKKTRQKKEPQATQTQPEPDTPARSVSAATGTPPAEPEGFARFWQNYPKQRAGNREKALRAYRLAVKRSGLAPGDLAQKARQYALSDEVARGYAKGAAAWLNDDRFLQDYKPPHPHPATSNLQEARARGNALIEEMFGGQK